MITNAERVARVLSGRVPFDYLEDSHGAMWIEWFCPSCGNSQRILFEGYVTYVLTFSICCYICKKSFVLDVK